jgi:hypothetical protein
MNTTNHTSPSGEELKACPFCGFQPEMDDPDFLYPILTDRTLWGAHCPSPAGGCSASVLGESRDEALVHWNSRAAVSTPPIGEDAANGAIGEREAFEAWARNEFNIDTGTPLFREGKGYMGLAINAAWRAWRGSWQARAALPAEKVRAEPVAWMIRIGDSNVWSYTQLESDADFYGKQSGLKYEKRPLYTAPAAALEKGDGRDAARWRWFVANYGALTLHEKFSDNIPRVFTHELKGRSWDEITQAIDAALSQKAGEQQ